MPPTLSCSPSGNRTSTFSNATTIFKSDALICSIITKESCYKLCNLAINLFYLCCAIIHRSVIGHIFKFFRKSLEAVPNILLFWSLLHTIPVIDILDSIDVVNLVLNEAVVIHLLCLKYLNVTNRDTTQQLRHLNEPCLVRATICKSCSISLVLA